ncbi:20_t:CDS:2 [Acaulospora colombiana]|uniref:20_t:CDS:1 n=1 Tax=Acaulospora colombiana TaxID=27376 RepID=A0ACA9PW79_9GLOM|nr:20_t:CDS:2 [Acaulospora colombiana]
MPPDDTIPMDKHEEETAPLMIRKASFGKLQMVQGTSTVKPFKEETLLMSSLVSKMGRGTLLLRGLWSTLVAPVDLRSTAGARSILLMPTSGDSIHCDTFDGAGGLSDAGP